MSGHHFAVCRSILGTYLAVHFGWLLARGVGVDVRYSLPGQGPWPAWFAVQPPSWLAQNSLLLKGCLLLGVVASMCLMLGVKRRESSGILCALWCGLAFMTPVLGHPFVPVLGLVLGTMAVLAPRESHGHAVSQT